MLRSAVPLLPTYNITETIDFYTAKLGFAAINYGNYARITLDATELHLFMVSKKTNLHTTGCLIMVDNVEDMFTKLSAKGLVDIKGKLADKPWGLKEFTIFDNNKNFIRFAQKRK